MYISSVCVEMHTQNLCVKILLKAIFLEVRTLPSDGNMQATGEGH